MVSDQQLEASSQTARNRVAREIASDIDVVTGVKSDVFSDLNKIADR